MYKLLQHKGINMIIFLFLICLSTTMFGMGDDWKGYPTTMLGIKDAYNFAAVSTVTENPNNPFRDEVSLVSPALWDNLPLQVATKTQSDHKKQSVFTELGMSFIGVLFANGAQNMFSQFSEDGKKFSILMLTFSGYLGSIYSTTVITENPGKMGLACLIGTPLALLMQKSLMSVCNLK